MCGIVGFYLPNSGAALNGRLLKTMSDSLRHRGPDDEGFFLEGPVGIGMRRLSIIDLKTGDQPITNEDRSVWVVFNGEIYNYRELTAELLAKGHRFATASDTEVLVHLYEEYGEHCVDRLRGMFAFAIWDRSRQALFLARDRLGIKPLYYAETPHGFVFGSELKAVVRSRVPSPVLNWDALRCYLQFGYVPDPLSIIEGVARLSPGHTLLVREGRSATPRPYWETTPWFSRHQDLPRLEEEASELLWNHLESAVRSHLVSDVPLGAFLSGGIDSSVVVGIMARELGARIKTFSVGFHEDGYNELPYARRVADWFGTDHHELVVEAGDLRLLEEVLSAFDEPFSDSSAIPTYLLSKMARQHVKVVLSGDGGDELFAGYERYVVDHRRRHLGILGDNGLGAPLRLLSEALPEGSPGKRYLYNLSLPRLQRYLYSVSLFSPAEFPNLLESDIPSMTESSFDAHLRAGEGLDPLSRLQDLDLGTYLPGDILTKVDRMTMAHSLEARVPLLDHVLVQFALGVPARLRFRAGVTKYLLRRAARGKVPQEILDRPKHGFGVPLESWFATRRPWFFHDLLDGGDRLVQAGIRKSSIRALLDLYARKRQPDHGRRLWALVVLDRTVQRLLNAGRTA